MVSIVYAFVCFFPRDTPLTQKAVNCNEWSLIIAPLDPVSLYRKKNLKFFWGLLVPPIFFFFFIERRWWVLQGGVSFWHTMILLLLFCYLITIPKHINDMEDIVVTPNLMFIFCCFCVNFTFTFYFSFLFSFLSWFYKCNLWKKNREENKNQHKSVSWQPMVTCKHNMAHCSFAYVKKMGGKYS